MKKIKTFKSFLEGVGDKYADRKFNMEPEFFGFEKSYKKHKILGEDEGQQNIFHCEKWGEDHLIIKNPISLKNFAPDVRGVIDKQGNLYLEQFPDLVHDDILYALEESNVLKYVVSWHIKIPTEFITVQRIGNKNLIVLGESNEMMFPDDQRETKYWKEHNIPKYSESEPVFKEFLRKAKLKNPTTNFENIDIEYYRELHDL